MCRIPGQEGGALSSCKFPRMQTRSQVPGRISDRSVWAENHGPGQGTCFLFCKKHLYHPVGTCRGEGAVSFVVCATGAGTASEPLCWGRLYFSVRLRRQEALSALPGPWRSALSAIREVLPALGLDIVPATPDSWLAGAECDRSEWPEGAPFPMDSEHDLLSRAPTGQALERAFRRRQLPALDDAHLPSTGSREQA